jgi:hypothetical protein
VFMHAEIVVMDGKKAQNFKKLVNDDDMNDF